MSLTVAILQLVGGLIYLLMGGDLLVRGAIALARRARISPMVVGLTVVALGTSAPELFVSLGAVFTGYPEIAVSNAVGSNIANVLLVVALPAMIYPLACDQRTARSDSILMLAVSLLFFGLSFDQLLSRLDGVLLVVGLFAFLAHQARSQLRSIRPPRPVGPLPIALGLPQRRRMITLLLVAGAVMLPVGANLVIGGAVGLAERVGVSNQVVGLTVVALSTSIPELATTMVAAFKRQADLAVGNVLGSNILNVLAIMGVTALASPLELEVPARFLSFDMPLMLVAALVLTTVAMRRGAVGRKLGGAMLLTYVAYTYLLYAGGA